MFPIFPFNCQYRFSFKINRSDTSHSAINVQYILIFDSSRRHTHTHTNTQARSRRTQRIFKLCLLTTHQKEEPNALPPMREIACMRVYYTIYIYI